MILERARQKPRPLFLAENKLNDKNNVIHYTLYCIYLPHFPRSLMHRPSLLSAFTILALLISSQTIRAQYIFAGQIIGNNYTDIIPDKVVSTNMTNPSGATKATDTLDLDGDGRFDLRIRASIARAEGTATNPINGYAQNWAFVFALHPNVSIDGQAGIQPIASNDTIPSRRQYHQPYWFTGGWLTYINSNFRGITRDGGWLNGQDHYAAVRLRPSPTAAWRYGWVRFQVRTTTDTVTIIAKDYAFIPGTALVQQPARVAGWEFYPVPASDWVTVRNPAATTGQLRIVDACGRQQLLVALTGVQQLLNLSSLAAGVYAVRFETATGIFIQRFSKL